MCDFGTWGAKQVLREFVPCTSHTYVSIHHARDILLTFQIETCLSFLGRNTQHGERSECLKHQTVDYSAMIRNNSKTKQNVIANNSSESTIKTDGFSGNEISFREPSRHSSFSGAFANHVFFLFGFI